MHPTRTTAVVAAAVSAVTALLVGGVTLAWANHAYPDHPTNNAFHEEVGNFAAAGCATGFPDGTFRGRDQVKRQQMARFINACGGRIDLDTGTRVDLDAGLPKEVISLEMEAGALADGGGFVLLDGIVIVDSLSADEADYPCSVEVEVPGGALNLELVLHHTGPGGSEEHAPLHALFPVDAGEQLDVTVESRVVNLDCVGDVRVSARGSLTYFPFDGTGAGGADSSLGSESTEIGVVDG